MIFEELVPHGGALVSKAVSLALQGDQQMLALCLNKLIPNIRPVDRTASFKKFSGSLTERGEKVLKAMATGQVTPGEASALLSALQAQAKLVEADELAQRVEVLERAAGQN